MILPRGFRRVVILCLALQTSKIARAQAPLSPVGPAGSDATAIMTAARDALGGEQRLAGVKTIVATGRTRQVQGDNLVPIEFEINIELPDKYVRTDEIPARESGPTSRGFNGDGLIQMPEAAGPARGAPPVGAPPARAGGSPGQPPTPATPLKQDFVRLTLGMFAASFSTYPVTFSYGGQAEAPEGKADVIDVKGASNFSARLFIDSKTHLPLMLSWSTPANVAPIVPGQPPPPNLPPGTVTFDAPGPLPGPGATQEERTKYQQDVLAARAKALASARPTENRLYYADYRDVDGLKLPFRLRRAVGALTIEETTFDRFRINARIEAKRFEVRQ